MKGTPKFHRMVEEFIENLRPGEEFTSRDLLNILPQKWLSIANVAMAIRSSPLVENTSKEGTSAVWRRLDR